MSFQRRKALPTSIAFQSGRKKLQDVALKTRTERLRFSKLRNSIPTTGTETVRSNLPRRQALPQVDG